MAINDVSTTYSEQQRGNSSFDKEFQTNVVQPLGFDGSNLLRETSSLTATKVTVSGNYTYVAVAPAGTSQASAKWQVFRVEKNGADTVVTWADGDSSFNNVASDLTALSFS